MKREVFLQYAVIITGAIVILIAALIMFVFRSEPSLPEKLAEALRQKLTVTDDSAPITFRGESTHANPLLNQFYNERDYYPAWFFKQ